MPVAVRVCRTGQAIMHLLIARTAGGIQATALNVPCLLASGGARVVVDEP